VERPLDTTESSFHALNATGAFLVTQIARVEGPLNADLLAAALAHVQQRHPLLRARIEPGPAPRWVTPPAVPPPLGVAPAGADPAAIAEEELHRLYDVEAAPLWRCTLVPDTADPCASHLVLGTHHALADGKSAWQILADVLATCAALVRGNAPPPYLPAGPSLDEVLRRTPLRAKLAHYLRRAWERLGLGRGSELEAVGRTAAAPLRSRLLRHALPAELVSGLCERARRAGATLTGALGAALLPSVVEEAEHERRVVPLAHAISLRGMGAPPIPAEQVGSFATGATLGHAIEPSRALWSVARAVSRGLHAVLHRGDPIAGVALARGSFARMEAHARAAAAGGGHGPVALSNRGRLPLQDFAPFALREWHGATGNHVQGNLSHLSCSTVNGALSVGYVHVEPLVPRTRAIAILGRFEERLWRMLREEDALVARPVPPVRRRTRRLALAS
jgi:hypothetical protein